MTKPFTPVPKPVSTKKKTGGKALTPTTKTVNMEAVENKRAKQNRANRQLGKATEYRVAKKVGGERTPLSGAVKNSNRNLTGDVEIRDAMGRDFMKLEVKSSAIVSTSGEKSYNMKLSVLKQTFNEADEAHEIGALVVHYKGNSEEYYVMREKDILELIEKAKLGCLYEATIAKDTP